MKPYLSEPQSTLVPAVAAIAINTAVLTELDSPCRALWVGTEGTLVVTMMDGQEVTFTAAQGLMPIRVTAIAAASTADGVVALY